MPQIRRPAERPSTPSPTPLALTDRSSPSDGGGGAPAAAPRVRVALLALPGGGVSASVNLAAVEGPSALVPTGGRDGGSPPLPSGATISKELASRIEASAEGPDLRIAGRLLHLYTCEGVYRGAWVPTGFEPLWSIDIAPHMLSDHGGSAILAALKGVRAALSAPEQPPPWVPFDQAENACACCGAGFSWETTLNSAAQHVCGQHHCRGCGRVVCGACSKKKQCFLQFGIVEPSRCCDACFFRG